MSKRRLPGGRRATQAAPGPNTSSLNDGPQQHPVAPTAFYGKSMKTLRDVNSPFDTRPDCMSHDKPAMADDDSFLDGHRDEEEEKMVYARKRNKCEASV